MSFFKEPIKIIDIIYQDMPTFEPHLQLGQAYLATGLLKGLGYQETLKYLDMTIGPAYVSKTVPEKYGRLALLNAFI